MQWPGRMVLTAAALATAGCGGDGGAPAKAVLLADAAVAPVPTVLPTSTIAALRAPLPLSTDRALPLPLRGVTADSVADVPNLVAALRAHHAVPTVRIVMDPDRVPADYAPAIDRIRPQAYVMAQLLDSTAMAAFTTAQVRQRARDFTQALAGRVDLWEVGNELNGAWVGRDPAEINAKALAAWQVVAGERHLRTAITLNYWSGPDCYEKPWEPTLTFARGMPAQLRGGVDYVFLSIYETACDPVQQPSSAKLAAALVALGRIFPKARLGIGEIGAQGKADGLPADPTLAEKQRIARRYYGMQADLATRVGPRFVGGYFWWYYAEDAVPRLRKESLWPLLDELFIGL